jgi:glycosyltransferase involved in cell wall biosynthesis
MSHDGAPPSPRPKVVRVITRLNIGGPAVHAVLLARRLGNGEGPAVLVTGEVEPHEGDMRHLAEAAGLRLVRIPTLRNSAGLREDLLSLIHLYRVFRRERPTIAHLHLTKARVLGGIAARLAGVPVVLETFHGTLFDGYFGRVKTRILLGVERLIARLMDGIIAISDRVAADLVARRVAPADRIQVVPLGLDLGRFETPAATGRLRAALGVDAGTPLVGAVARLVPIKGLQTFVEAAAIVVGAEPRARFAIVGDGPERPALERQVKALALADHLTMLGWRRDVADLYPDLDVVVQPSLNEGTPLTLIEAMAAGRAVVATRVGGVPDLVTDGADGVLVPAGNAPALAEAVVRLLGDPQQRRRLGEAARHTARRRFSSDRLVSDMDALYRACTGHRQTTVSHRRTLLYWRATAVLWAAGILGVSIAPIGPWPRPLEAARHVLAFAGLTFLLRRAPLPLSAAAALSFIYGLAMEVIQIPIPYRSGRLVDLFVDIVGIAAAGLVLWMADRAG